jgi:hypothetical protein
MLPDGKMGCCFLTLCLTLEARFGGASSARQLRGIAVCSPQGCLVMGLLRIGGACPAPSPSGDQCVVPALWEVVLIQLIEAAVFLSLAYWIDKQTLAPLQEQAFAPSAAALASLDEDVRAERDRVGKLHVAPMF